MTRKKLITLLWMRHLLATFEYCNDDPEKCWEHIMSHIMMASLKALEADKNNPLQGIDQDVVKNFSKGYTMALIKYQDIKVVNEKMKEKVKATLLKNLGWSEEELMKDIKLLYAHADLMINGIHIDNTNPITNN